MRRRAVVSLLGSCLLAACAHQGDRAAAPAGMSWALQHAEGEGAKLTYGAPRSDHVFLMMTCAPQSGQVLLSLSNGSAEGPAALELASGDARSRVSGEAVPSGLGAGSLVEASASVEDAALARFARTGEIAVGERGRLASLPASAAERAEIDGFFATCRA